MPYLFLACNSDKFVIDNNKKRLKRTTEAATENGHSAPKCRQETPLWIPWGNLCQKVTSKSEAEIVWKGAYHISKTLLQEEFRRESYEQPKKSVIPLLDVNHIPRARIQSAWRYRDSRRLAKLAKVTNQSTIRFIINLQSSQNIAYNR